MKIFKISFIFSLEADEHFLIPEFMYIKALDFLKSKKTNTLISYRFTDYYLTKVNPSSETLYGSIHLNDFEKKLLRS